MVISRDNARRGRQQGSLSADLVAALTILVLAALPMAFAFEQETRLCRAAYHRAVAMEIVDGEMEILAAGEWRAIPDGEHPYPVKAAAARNLPPGCFILTRQERALKLEWKPSKRRMGGPVTREVRLP
jgi:hypothetical protein